MSILLEDIRLNPRSFKLFNKVVKLQGDDAINYLNSQTTNSLNGLAVSEFAFNSILDLSGKIIASFVNALVDEKTVIIFIEDKYLSELVERIEKFHISEDFEVTVENRDVFLNLNTSGDFKGNYFFENDSISFEARAIVGTDQELLKLRVLTGVPELGVQAKTGELINNTFFDELSVDYKKGCFPGQETVSKINTRRGAAYKPVLGISESAHSGEVKLDGKKVGTIISHVEIEGLHYHYISLLRNYRIDNSELGDFKIYYYPYIKSSKTALARELYDEAIELFQNNEDEKAKSYFQKAIDLDPKFEDAYESLGVLYGRLGDFEKAIELMLKLKEINQKSMMAYTNLSLYHMKLGEIEKAEDYKSQATLLNFELLGDEADRKRKEDEIRKQKEADRQRREGMFIQVLEMDPEDAMANNGLGEILFEKADYQTAADHFEKAIANDAKYSVAYLGLAKCYIKLNKLEKFKEIVEKGIIVAGKNGDLMPANEMQSLKTTYL